MDMLLRQEELRILDTVSETVERAIVSGNPLVATDFANDIIRSGQVRGLALAKLFFEVKSKWELFQASGIEDEFENFMYIHTGKDPQTIRKYALMWENLFNNPSYSEETKQKLMGRNIRDLLLLTALAGDTTEDVLQEAAEAPNSNSVRDIVRRERGAATSANSALRIYCQFRKESNIPEGTLYIRDENGKPTIIGTLHLNSGDERTERAVNRILNSSHIQEVL
jgi:hypothetical protein